MTPGGTAMKPGQAQDLSAALAAHASPPNPKTPNDRTDPQEAQILNMQRARRALEILRDGMMDGDPSRDLVAAMHSAVSKLRDGISPDTVKMTMLQTLSPSPMLGGLGAPGAMPGMPGMPGPNPITAGAPPAPGPMDMPVSPSPLG